MAKTVSFADSSWHNWHMSIRNMPIAGRYELHNSAGKATLERMVESVTAIQTLIGKAFVERRRLRAHGAAWSFSEAPAVPGGYPLATGFANWLFPLPSTHVHPSYVGDRDGLFLCQTGISVAELNIYLERKGRSLATSGASNGQTFVGAMSTGTHGSAIDHPSMQGQVAAIQLIPSPDRNLWIEPASAPATDGRLAASLGAVVVRDDLLFQAVLIGLGAFGVIHSILVKTVPIFLLEMNRQRVPLDADLKSVMVGGSFDGVNLPGPDSRPYFFQSIVNEHIDKGFAYVTTGHKLAWDPAHILNYDIEAKRGPGYNVAVVLANLLQAFPGLTPAITKAVLSERLGTIIGKKGSWGETFNYTTPRAGTAGAATAVPIDRTFDVLDIFERAQKKVGKAPVAFACRYAVQSPGLLAFIRFPKTTIIDIDGIDTKATRQVMAQAINDLRAAGIPHAEHWGKLNQMTAVSVRDAYGSNLEKWMKARTDLLDRDGEYVFGSAFLDRLGMTNPVQ